MSADIVWMAIGAFVALAVVFPLAEVAVREAHDQRDDARAAAELWRLRADDAERRASQATPTGRAR